MGTQWFVVFCSPAGSTRHVADVVAAQVRTLSADVHLLDLGKERDWSPALTAIDAAGSDVCLFIGSPVYRDLAVPPVMSFIERLSAMTGGNAVPFVTWGHAASGIALWQMGTALKNKGLLLAGAAKIAAVHSLMWASEEPLGKGHPDARDDLAIREVVTLVGTRVADPDFAGIPLDSLDYQPADRVGEMKRKLEQPLPSIPRIVDEHACSQCAICADLCPAGAITMDPFPRFNEQCIDCFNCIHHCPEAAIEPKMSLTMIEEMIRKRSALMNESPDPVVW
jgi:ferredoxin